MSITSKSYLKTSGCMASKSHISGTHSTAAGPSYFSSGDFDHYLEIAKEYATQEYETVKVTRAARGQHNKARIIHQSTVGKLGEFIAWAHLHAYFDDVEAPDLEVTRFKSYDADLYADDIPIGVKSQDKVSADRYGASWMFQKRSAGSNADPIVTRGNELYVFVIVDIRNKSAQVYGPTSIAELRPFFKPPKLKHLTSKTVLYLEDIISLVS